MRENEIIVHDPDELLSEIQHLLERKEINVSSMCQKLGIPRSTFYGQINSNSKCLEMVLKVINYLGLEVSLKLACE